MGNPDDSRVFNVQARWPTSLGIPVPTTQFAASLSATQVDEEPQLVLACGYAAPPLLVGTPEEQAVMMAALDSFDVLPVANMLLTKTSAVQLRDLLTAAIAKWDERSTISPEGEDAQ